MAQPSEGGAAEIQSSKKVTTSEINEKIKLILESRKSSNLLVDLLTYFQDERPEILLQCIKGFHKVFVRFIKEKEMYMERVPSESDREEKNNQDTYKQWLRGRYLDVTNRLLELVSNDHVMVQELAMCTLMKFVAAEGQTPLKKISEKHLSFPSNLFEHIVGSLLSTSCELKSLIERFQEYIEYDDVRYYLMKFMSKNLKGNMSEQDNMGVYMNNFSCLLGEISVPNNSEDETLSNFLSKLPVNQNNVKIIAPKEHKKLFTGLWLDFLRNELPTSLYKKILIMIHDKVMPNMTSPLQLADFLTESYNIGGAISLLALNGLFVLISKYNLSYPNFYTKLYALFEPTIFHAKYAARFFHLADIFLSSTHLPAYLVAAFIKRLSRLCLTAPVPGLTVAIPFIYNLIQRHPSCQVLLHSKEQPTDVNHDPYDMAEGDPSKSNSLESSLWEIQSLQGHYDPDISVEAEKVNDSLPCQESDISEMLDSSYSNILKKVTCRKFKDIPVTFLPPSDDILYSTNSGTKDIWMF